MLYFTEPRCKPGARFAGMIIERPHSPAINDVTILAHDVDTFGPRRISVIGCVVHFIYAEGQRVMEALDKIVGDYDSLFERFWLGITNIILNVGLHLPFIRRMRLTHINRKEIRVIFVIVVDLRDVA